MNVQIREVANGWEVIPGEYYNREEMIACTDVHVFNSFDQMTAFLRTKSKLLNSESPQSDQEER